MEPQPTSEHPIHGIAAYTNAILDRLVEQYLTRTALPGTEQHVLTIERFHRLYQCVLAEGYGR
jgi:hypothetical protein